MIKESLFVYEILKNEGVKLIYIKWCRDYYLGCILDLYLLSGCIISLC